MNHPPAVDHNLGPIIVPLSAPDQKNLRQTAALWSQHLANAQDGDLAVIADVAANQRPHLAHRAVLVVETLAGLRRALTQVAAGETAPHIAVGVGPKVPKPRVAFVYPGQGSQWLGMGRRLYQSQPAFATALDACAAAIEAAAGWDLRAELFGLTPQALTQTRRIQPALFAVQVALTKLWAAWGIRPDEVIGHSMGEISAAHAAGILTLADAVTIMVTRAGLVERKKGLGAMAVCELSLADAQAAVAPFDGRLSVAANNGPRTCLISGEPEAIKQLEQQLKPRDIFFRQVKVAYASHCHQMDDLTEPLRHALQTIKPRRGHIPLRSTVRNQPLTGPEMDPDYWAHNLRDPVRFYEASQTMLAEKTHIFLEMSAHPVLGVSLKETIRTQGCDAATVAGLRRDSDDRFTAACRLAHLAALGLDPDWSTVVPITGKSFDLPNLQSQPDETPSSVAIHPAHVIARNQPLSQADAHRVDAVSPRHTHCDGHPLGGTHLFLSHNEDALLSLTMNTEALLAFDMEGPPEALPGLIQEVHRFATESGREFNLLDERGHHRETLEQLGFSATMIGSRLSLKSQLTSGRDTPAWRRLHYLVSQYAGPHTRLRAYPRPDHPGTNRALQILLNRPGNAGNHRHRQYLETAITTGTWWPAQTVFLVESGQRLDGCAVVTTLTRQRESRLETLLLAPEAPAGCAAFVLNRLPALLGEAGSQVLDLGLELGRYLQPYPNEDVAVRAFFERNRAQSPIGNEDLHKFRPQRRPALLYRSKALSTRNLETLIV